jgi:hypothetical protein
MITAEMGADFRREYLPLFFGTSLLIDMHCSQYPSICLCPENQNSLSTRTPSPRGKPTRQRPSRI